MIGLVCQFCIQAKIDVLLMKVTSEDTKIDESFLFH